MTLTRLKDWRARYEAAIDEIKSVPFAWGTHDCGPNFAGRIVQAVTGNDLVSHYAGLYSDEEGAAGVIRRAGFDSLGAMVASMLPTVHPSMARVGDLAAIALDGPIGHGLGVVNGERVYVLTETGLGTVRLLKAVMAFKVG